MKFANIIEAVNTIQTQIDSAKEKGLTAFVEIIITRCDEDKYVIIVRGSDNVGRNYTSLELHIEKDMVYWENIPIGYKKDLLPNSVLLHQ